MLSAASSVLLIIVSHWKIAVAAVVILSLTWSRRLMFNLLPLVLTLAIIVQWAIALLVIADAQPGSYMLHDITVASTARQVELGRVALMQNAGLAGSADERHVKFERAQNSWKISNLSTRRKLRLEYVDDKGTSVGFDSARLPIAAGDVLVLTEFGAGGERIRFEDVAADGRKLRIRIESAAPAVPARDYSFEWRATGVTASDGQSAALPACGFEDQASFAAADALRKWRNNYSESRDAVVLQFGGPLECVNGNVAAVPLGGSPFAAATLRYVRGLGFALTRGREPAAKLLRGSQEIWLANVAHDLNAQFGGSTMKLRSFVAGYTKYTVEPPGPGERNIAFRILPAEKSHRVMGGSKVCNIDAVVADAGDLGIRVAPRCRPAPNAGEEWRKSITDGSSAARSGIALTRWSIATLRAAGAMMVDQVVARPWLAAVAIAGVAGVLIAYFVIRLRRRFATAPIFEADHLVGKLLRLSVAAFAIAILVTYIAWKAAPASSPIPLPPWPALAAWALAGLAVATARGSSLLDGLILTVLTALVAVGHVAQVQLTLASGELRNLRFADDTTAAVAATAALIMLVSQIGPNWLAEQMRSLSVPTSGSVFGRASARIATWTTRAPAVSSGLSGGSGLPLGMWVALLIIGGALAVWFAFGTEAGIAGVLQPSEIVKTLTVFILAATITLALEPDRGPESRVQRLGYVRTGSRLQTVFSFAVATLWSARLCLVVAIVAAGLRLALVRSGMLAAVLEVAVLVASLGVIAVWLRSLKNFLWRAFLMIIVLLAAILLVPVVRNDLSPFVVLVATSVVTFLFVVVIHGLAIASEQLQVLRPQRAPPPDTSRPRSQRGLASSWVGRVWMPARALVRRVLARPEPWMVSIFAGVAFAVWFICSTALDDAYATRKALMVHVGGSLNKPIERVISWIEFNGKAKPGTVVGIEFADVGLQVARSRDVIEASDCRTLDRSVLVPDSKHPLPRMLEAAASLPLRFTEPVISAAAALVHSDLLPCAGISARPNAASRIAARMPAIQNDFVSTWLVAIYGRDGAVGIVMLQCLLLAAMLFAGFMTIRWTPGHLLNRPAASVAGYATVGFAVMLGVQWTISWLNALGALPVMGQPSTFLSHGPSHGLLFGAPAVLTAICALRLRIAFLTPKSTSGLNVRWRDATLGMKDS
jgi:hypothetical protein